MDTPKRLKFILETIDGTDFEGWSDGSTWNGFEVPYFERETAVAILKASEQNGYRWHYDVAQDAFVVSHQDDPADYEPELFQGFEIEIEGAARKLYPVGSSSWIWEVPS